jgi:hypothetical protein
MVGPRTIQNWLACFDRSTVEVGVHEARNAVLAVGLALYGSHVSGGRNGVENKLDVAFADDVLGPANKNQVDERVPDEHDNFVKSVVRG